MANFLEKAKNFLFLAESKAEFNLFGINHQMAADNFFRAANYYMLAESWEEAGSTYVKLANFYFKTERKDRAARAFVDAALCYEQLDTTEPPVYCLEHAVNLFCDIGHLSKAARYLKEIAELYENEQNIEQAIVYYERSADFYQNDEMTTSANQCKQKVAQFAAQLEQYQKSIEIYEEIARQSLSNNWTKHETKCHLLNAGICELCKRDPVAINNALEIYQELDPTFTETREYSLLVDVAAAIDKQDVRKFTNVVNDFDSMTPLDSLKRALIMRVKKKIFIF